MRPEPTIALLDWTHLLEDYLDNIGVSFEQFRRELRGGWTFGYVAALRSAGLRPILLFVSGRVRRPWRFVHEPTGAPAAVLPSPAAYRAIRRRIVNPYAYRLDQAASVVRPFERPLLALLKEGAPYCSTPLIALARELRRERCAALVCQEYENPRFDVSVALGRLVGVPVFGTFQGGAWQASRFERPFRPLALRAAAGVIAGSTAEIDRLRRRYRLAARKVAQIFNPLDLDDWQPEDRAAARAALGMPAEAKAIAWHGRVQLEIKGLDLLVEAWSRVRAASSAPVWLLILGSGQDAAVLRAHLEAAGPGPVVWRDEFVHDRGEVRRFLAAADVYAFPSRREGFPVAPVEAMACGLPVVAADVTGIADIFPEGERSGGLVVPLEDPAALAAALARVLEDHDLRRVLGERARRRALDAFSVEQIGRQLRAFLLQ